MEAGAAWAILVSGSRAGLDETGRSIFFASFFAGDGLASSTAGGVGIAACATGGSAVGTAAFAGALDAGAIAGASVGFDATFERAPGGSGRFVRRRASPAHGHRDHDPDDDQGRRAGGSEDVAYDRASLAGLRGVGCEIPGHRLGAGVGERLLVGGVAAGLPGARACRGPFASPSRDRPLHLRVGRLERANGNLRDPELGLERSLHARAGWIGGGGRLLGDVDRVAHVLRHLLGRLGGSLRRRQGFEGLGEFGCGLIAIFRLCLERPQDRSAENRPHASVGIALRERHRRLVKAGREDLLKAPAAEGTDPGEPLVHDDAEGKEIAAPVDRARARLLGELFGRGISELPDELVRGSQLLLLLRAGELGDAQVDQLRLQRAVLFLRHHDVVGSDVAVNDSLAMQVVERRQALPREVDRETDGQRSAVADHVAQVDPVDVLHDHVRGALVVNEEIVETDDVAMFEPRGHLGFAEESLALIRALGDLRPHDLDDPDFVQEAVAHHVNGTHAALADLPEDLVLAFDGGVRGVAHGRLAEAGQSSPLLVFPALSG